MTDDELSDEDLRQQAPELSNTERLFAAFNQRHIRLRLQGTKLPPNYTISLRLPSANDRTAQPRKPKRKRRRIDPATVASRKAEPRTDSETDDETTQPQGNQDASRQEEDDVDEAALASEDDESATIRTNNAYTGASNTIGSIHQRHWFLTLDRKNSGFHRNPSTNRWEGSWELFFVRGRDVERSVVTGRNADEVMEDEGMEKFVGRKMWRAILE